MDGLCVFECVKAAFRERMDMIERGEQWIDNVETFGTFWLLQHDLTADRAYIRLHFDARA